jgi:hypothetical protein
VVAPPPESADDLARAAEVAVTAALHSVEDSHPVAIDLRMCS